MVLYLNGWEAYLVEKALKDVVSQGGTNGENAKILIERMAKCRALQKPHIKQTTHLMRLDGNQPKH